MNQTFAAALNGCEPPKERKSSRSAGKGSISHAAVLKANDRASPGIARKAAAEALAMMDRGEFKSQTEASRKLGISQPTISQLQVSDVSCADHALSHMCLLIIHPDVLACQAERVTIPSEPTTVTLTVHLEGGNVITYEKEVRFIGEAASEGRRRTLRNAWRKRRAIHAAAVAQLPTCAVCQSTLDLSSSAALDACSHRFCVPCILAWCMEHGKRSCPCCHTTVSLIRGTSKEAEVLYEFQQAMVSGDIDLASDITAEGFVEDAQLWADKPSVVGMEDAQLWADEPSVVGIEDAQLWAHLQELNPCTQPSQQGARLPLRQAEASAPLPPVPPVPGLTQRVLEAARRLGARWSGGSSHEMRRRSQGAALDPKEAVPHETAGLARRVGRNASAATCTCSKCGRVCSFSVLLGRAHAFEYEVSAMWGAGDFRSHTVGKLILLAEQMVEDEDLNHILLPFCDRDYFDEALTGSLARAQATALATWHDELHLNAMASAASGAALELPFVQQAPQIPVPFAGLQQQVKGKAFCFLALDRSHVLGASAALRRLWAKQLTPELLQGYSPVVLSETLVLRMAANAIALCDGSTSSGECRAGALVASGGLAAGIFQMDSNTIKSAREAAAAFVQGNGRADQLRVMRDCLRNSSVSHMWAPQFDTNRWAGQVTT
jgi:hypothetical protein